MGRISLGVLFAGEGLSVDQVIELGVACEDAGFDSVWHAEVQRDPWTPLAVIASRTKRIRLGTGVAVWARSPALAELEAASLDELSGGRFVFGLGTAPQLWNENHHNVSYQRPVERMREYVEVIRGMWASHEGPPFSYAGRRFTVRDYQRAWRPQRERIPIFLAAVQERMTQLVGAIGDGVLFNVMTTPRYLTEFGLPHLERGARRAGRSLADLEVGGVLVTAVSDDLAQAREWARHHIAFYTVIPYFDLFIDRHGFQREAAKVREAAARGDVRGMFDAVTDEMVDTYSAAGPPDRCRAKLREYEGTLQLATLFAPTFHVGADEILANHCAILETFST